MSDQEQTPKDAGDPEGTADHQETSDHEVTSDREVTPHREVTSNQTETSDNTDVLPGFPVRPDTDDLATLAGYEDDLRQAERKVAGEIDPGARGIVVAIAVLVAMVSLVLPHTGSASGLDVLTMSDNAVAERVAITSRVFVYLLLIFGIAMSMLALLTRRWIIAWIALCGCAVGCVAGMLAWWTRNTPGVGGIQPPSGVGIGLILGWIAVFVLTFHWARVVWARSTYHLALEEQRRIEATKREEATRRIVGQTGMGPRSAGDPDA